MPDTFKPSQLPVANYVMDLRGDPSLENIIPTYILKLNLIPTDTCNSQSSTKKLLLGNGEIIQITGYSFQRNQVQPNMVLQLSVTPIPWDVTSFSGYTWRQSIYTHIYNMLYIKYMIYNKH